MLLSTFENFTTIVSTECDSCNVSNKYNSSLSNNNFVINENNEDNLNENLNHKIFIDSLLISSESKKNGIVEKNNITVDNFLFKTIESNNLPFPNSDLIDGILSLSYNNMSRIPNDNFIMELYNEGKISSPSFSIIITSSKINRLYLGDIMKNEYIKNYINTSMNKGECEIIDNKWQCKIERLEYIDFIFPSSNHRATDSSLVKFNLKENKLYIPYYYYDAILV